MPDWAKAMRNAIEMTAQFASLKMLGHKCVFDDLTPAQYGDLADVPPELEWLANITNPKTRRAYKDRRRGILAFTGLREPASCARSRAPCHRLAQDMEARAGCRPPASAASSRRCLRSSIISASAMPSPAIRWTASSGRMANGNEGSTPALGDAQARDCWRPPPDTLKGVRDRAILATLLYHGIRREELCQLRVRDMQSRQGVMHFRIKGKRDKIRFVSGAPDGATADRGISALAKHGGGQDGWIWTVPSSAP
jgi:integrase/recombinase XerD